MDVYGIAAFRSRQQVLRYEALLAQNGITSRVVSTPREIAVGCGLSLQFSLNDLQAVQNIVSRDRPANLIGLYMIDRRSGRPQLTVVSK
ncbi:MAG: DUF3343 domain-containing protein [Clostridia bacterium]|nr:DUF3343 domain-containing protein [Clostridia bacterium]MBR4441919.1 DUF3343 domain-containing protein [Clostridia bacterium]